MGEKGQWTKLQHTELSMKAKNAYRAPNTTISQIWCSAYFSPSQAPNDPGMIHSCSSTDDNFFHLPAFSPHAHNCTSPTGVHAKGQSWPKACSLAEVSWEMESICRVMNELPKVSCRTYF